MIAETRKAANGSGRALLVALNARGLAASRQDRAAVMVTYSKVIRKSVSGELTLPSLNSFLKAYRRARRDVAPGSRQTDDAEIEMMNLIGYKDADVRTIFEVRGSEPRPRLRPLSTRP